MFDKYAELCKEEKLKLGNLWLYDVPNGNKKVLNVAIKEHWKHHVTYDTINEILLNFVFMYQVLGIKSVAFPILGQGNLNKQKVLNLMFQHLEKCKIPIEIYDFA